MDVNAGDRYDTDYQDTGKRDQPDCMDEEDWESGNKSVAEEAIERVKEIVGRGRVLDESDDHR